MTKITVTLLLLITNFIFAQETKDLLTESPDESITRLDLSKKGLTSLKDYNFSKYLQLQELDLSDNDLTHIKEDAFVKNEQLKSINLSGNKHLEFPKYSTIFIAKISNLNISGCGIRALPQSAFDGLRYLKTIDLSDNPLDKRSFPTTPFGTIESLERVILPVENKPLLKELCLSFNLTIEIRSEDVNIPGVQCSNYVNYEESEEEDQPLSIVPDPETTQVSVEDHQITEAPVVKPRLEPREEKVEPVPIPELPAEGANETETQTKIVEVPTAAPKLEPRVVPTVEEHNETIPNIPAVVTDVPAEIKEHHPRLEITTPIAQANKSEKIQQEEPAKVGEVTASSNTGSTILIVLVVLVVVAGLAAFGYKFYKNKTARAESEQVERELKEIVANKNIRAEIPMDVVEKEPLMNNHLGKENGSKRNSGSPYQPTTTTFKPEGTS